MEADMVTTERQEVVNSFLEEVAKWNDPRMDRCKKHSLSEIFLLVLCAQINFKETMREYEMYGEFKIELLRKFLPYKHGAPSRSTIARVLALFNPDELSKVFVGWMKQVIVKAEQQKNELEQKENEGIKGIAIDGKTNRGLQGQTLHTVSAYDTRAGLVLAEEKVADKSNEITAIPEVMEKIDIAGSLVSIDAIGTQRSIAALIRSKGADYLLALKQNQKNLYEAVSDYFGDKELLEKCSVTKR
jgi:predicted transposase YbfD/YdcC